MAPIALRIPDAARVSGCSRTRLFGMIRSGELKSVKIGKRRLILAESLRARLSEPT
jgi:excisionase family DNA binding protein